jgi:quinol monooxygenase YgiN
MESEMEAGRVINIVAAECHPEDEAKFNKWYNEIHIPMLFTYDGMLAVTRYRMVGGPEGQARYLAVYEFKDQAALDGFQKSAEMAAAREEMGQTWKARGFDIKWRAQYEPLKTWKK